MSMWSVFVGVMVIVHGGLSAAMRFIEPSTSSYLVLVCSVTKAFDPLSLEIMKQKFIKHINKLRQMVKLFIKIILSDTRLVSAELIISMSCKP